jgi:hypothetical protein
MIVMSLVFTGQTETPGFPGVWTGIAWAKQSQAEPVGIRAVSAGGQAPGTKRAGAAGKRPFEYKDGLLSIEARQRPLSEIAGQIAEAAGVLIILLDPAHSAAVSVEMTNTPLDQALKTILKGYNHLVIYNPGREGPGVWVVHQSKASVLEKGKNSAPVLAREENPEQKPPAIQAGQVQTSQDEAPSDRNEAAKGDDQEDLKVASLSDAQNEGGDRGESEEGGPSRSEAALAEAPPQKRPSSQAMKNNDDQPSAGESNISLAANSSPSSDEGLGRTISMYEKRIASGVSDREYERNVKLSGGGAVMHDRDRIRLWQDALKRNGMK